MEYRASPENPVPIIYQSGYLTIKGYDKETDLYTLGFPNDEVAGGFLYLIAPYYTSLKETQKQFIVTRFVKELKAGDVDDFMTRMQSVYATLPTHTNKTHDIERDYQVVFLILFELIGLYIDVEKQTPSSRCDAVITTKEYVYVIEFKLSRDGSKTNTAEQALEQINSKGYAIPYQADGKKVVKIGAEFSGETGALVRWLVE